MTMASTFECDLPHPTGINRAAQLLGRALVAWGERPTARTAERPFDGAQQLAAERLMNERALSVSNRRPPLF
jgi:hypothetical protein